MLAVTFQLEAPILASNSTYPKSVFGADFDGDGDADIVVASLVDNKISWYENLDGKGTFGQQRVVSNLAIGAATVYAADLDGDGDTDVISGGVSAYDSDISWYANDGQGNFGEQQVVSAEVQGTDSVFAADLDGDGDLDLLSASREENDAGKVAWYENLDGEGTFGQQRLLTDTANGATTVVAADFDGDGDLDVVAGSYNDNSIRWFENDGNGEFGDENLLSDTATTVTAVSVADLDADGDLDIVFTSRGDNTVGWFPNQGTEGGTPQFAPERLISLDGRGPNELFIADLDGDDLLDLVIANRVGDEITWYKNMGDGQFAGPRVITDDADGASAVFAVDVDDDGDLDLFSTSRFDNKVAFYRNLDGEGTFSSEVVLSEQGSPGAQYVGSGDVDGDGDMDAVASSFVNDTVSWFENLDGDGTFGPERLISDRTNGPSTVLLADLDGDGDNDAISASYFDSKLAWYENVDGNGNFGPQRLISGDAIGLSHIAVADIDGDGHPDLLSASRVDNKVAWYRNLDGTGNFDFQIVVSLSLSNPTFVESADVDGDGDLDIIANGYDPDNSALSWFENVDGDGTFGRENLITRDVLLPTSIATADFDGDGDIDIVAASGGDDRVIWYENDGDGDFVADHLISDTVDGAFSVQAADFDGDGDTDVIVAAILGRSIVIFENENGTGSFSTEQLVTDQVFSPTSVFVADLDGDNDLDILSSDSGFDRISWYRNDSVSVELEGDFNGDGTVDVQDVDQMCEEILAGGLNDEFDLTGDGSVNRGDMNELIVNIVGTTAGDSNLDAVFNSADFVLVLSAGEFLDAIDGNSTWAEGDWNCDGDFNTQDLVLALQAGGFNANATPALDWQAVAAAMETNETTNEKVFVP